MRGIVPAVAAALLLGACSGAPAGGPDVAPAPAPGSAAPGSPAPAVYGGPMRLAQDFADDATVTRRGGAAVRALECGGSVFGGGGDYRDGLMTVRRGPMAALAGWSAQQPDVPSGGFVVERRAGHRVLLSYDVAGRTRIAVIVFDGVKDYRDKVGWGVESWARCDPSELPASVTDRFDTQIWSLASGARVPVTEVHSFQGAEHCGWQDITFLQVGPDGADPRETVQYVRDVRGEFTRRGSTRLLSTTFAKVPAPPAGSTDTGFRHAGRQLWLGPTSHAAVAAEAYLVSITDPADVERWPRSVDPIGCL